MPGRYRESPAKAAFRFVLELASWVFIYFAWGMFPLVVAIAALTVLSVPGDKHMVLVPVPGLVRIALEALVAVAGILGAWATIGPAAASVMAAAHVGLLLTAYRRWVWLWRA